MSSCFPGEERLRSPTHRRESIPLLCNVYALQTDCEENGIPTPRCFPRFAIILIIITVIALFRQLVSSQERNIAQCTRIIAFMLNLSLNTAEKLSSSSSSQRRRILIASCTKHPHRQQRSSATFVQYTVSREVVYIGELVLKISLQHRTYLNDSNIATTIITDQLSVVLKFSCFRECSGPTQYFPLAGSLTTYFRVHLNVCVINANLNPLAFAYISSTRVNYTSLQKRYTVYVYTAKTPGHYHRECTYLLHSEQLVLINYNIYCVLAIGLGRGFGLFLLLTEVLIILSISL